MCAMSQAIIQCPAQCLKGVLVKSSKGVAAAGVLGDVYTSGLSENMTKYSSLLMNKSICVQAGSYQCLKKYGTSYVISIFVCDYGVTL